MKNHKKEIKKIILILACISVIVTIIFIIQTYAKYVTNVSGSSSIDIAKWHILVNGTDIVTGTVEKFDVDALITVENKHTKEKKLAPGSAGGFMIAIEPMDTQVSVRYDISIDQSEIKNQKLSLYSVEEIDTGNPLIETEPNVYTGIILLKDIVDNYINNIEIIFVWENDESNDDDIILGTTPGLKIPIPIMVTVNQYMGETIKAYNEI